LFWAWFGAGKTHTLYYLANQATEIAKDLAKNALYTVYSEFPKAARGFLDLYRVFVLGLDTDKVVESFLEIHTSASAGLVVKNMTAASPDLVTALKVMTTGEPSDQVTAMRWLRAEALPISEYRRIGIAQKIGSSEEALRILTSLIQLLELSAQSQGRPGARVIWFVDEFQRIEKTGPRTLDEINTGLHSAFNACPNGLSLCLSFSGKPRLNSLPPWFSPELRDRIGRTKVMILPPMQPTEALGFIRDVLAQLRLPGFNGSPFFPFTKNACKLIVDEVGAKDELKPRSLMHAFNAVLQEADPRIEAKEMDAIPPEFAKQVLAEYQVLEDGEEET